LKNLIQFYIFTYKDSNINDIVCIIKAKHTDVLVSKYIEIEKLDISDLYSDIVKLNKIISIFRTYVMDNSVNKKTTYEGFYTDKSINNNLYNMLINDCNFEKELVNGKNNIAKLKFNK
jgi:hypothetical protein